jgi:general secretion pathway protein G
MKGKWMRQRRQRGFTLLELLVVMFILVILAGAVTVLVTQRIEQTKHSKAVVDVESLGNAIDQYHLDNSAFPAALDALRTRPSGDELPNWNGPYIKKAVPDDPWGKPYIFVAPGEHNADSYDLYSLGKDGKEGGSGSDADVKNWD